MSVNTEPEYWQKRLEEIVKKEQEKGLQSIHVSWRDHMFMDVTTTIDTTKKQVSIEDVCKEIVEMFEAPKTPISDETLL